MFERDVSIGGLTYTRHECYSVEHVRRPPRTLVHARSEGRSGEVTRLHERELDDSMGLDDCEAWLRGLPEYAEAADPAELAAREAEAALSEALSLLTDEQAGGHEALFPEWSAGAGYVAGLRVRHGGSLWRCVQAHASQEGWGPTEAPALWAEVRAGRQGGGGDAAPAAWVQPAGAHDAYAKGDRVTHGGKVWVSTAGANAWEPGTYGWEEE